MKCGAMQCKRRLSISDESVPCKCGGRFCDRHRFYAMHGCPHDYRRIAPAAGPRTLRSNEHQDYSNTAF